jgi:hypothetical protein
MATGWKRPGGHAVHSLAPPSEKVPGGQGSGTLMPVGQKKPARHVEVPIGVWEGAAGLADAVLDGLEVIVGVDVGEAEGVGVLDGLEVIDGVGVGEAVGVGVGLIMLTHALPGEFWNAPPLGVVMTIWR